MKNFKKFVSLYMTILMMTNYAYASSVTAIQGSVSKIVNAVAYAGYVVAIAMLAFVGMKYAMSPANEKADVKKGSVNYLIGAFFIICASGVANLVAGIAGGGKGNLTTGLAGTIIDAAKNAAN